MLVWIDAARCGQVPKIFGLTLVERHLQGLKRSIPRPTKVIVDLGSDGQKPFIDPSITDTLTIEWRETSGDFATRLQLFLTQAAKESVILLDGTTLLDSRLHAAVVALTDSVAITAPKENECAAIIRLEPDRLQNLSVDATNLHEWAINLQSRGTVRAYQPGEFNGFIRKLRRTIPYYLFYIDNHAKAAKVEKFMFWSNYKGSTDFFTRYVYPPFVWILVGPLARARVHPNSVTIFSIILALGAIPIWAIGETWSFWTGFAMAYGMSILDSVDGKLARLTFTDSRLGNFLDHGLDMIHPPFWYLSWAYGLGLATLGWESPLGIATIFVMAFYVIDRLILKIYPTFFKRAFHTHSKLDGRMRTFIARRNITLPMFIIGYILEQAVEAFYIIAAWQILTATYHGVRTFWILVIDRAHHKNKGPTDVAAALDHVE